MGIRILCTGDVHIGRRVSALPEGLDARAAGPGAAWEACVRAAIENQVDAVALTGDVVDEANRFYEAYSVLQAGVGRLVEAGIAVFAVAGNHDAEVLGRLADQMPQFRLLGRGGHWQEAFLPSADSPRARFVGWSFPGRSVLSDPLASYSAPDRPMPTIGLLHCDADTPGSTYGPVSVSGLAARRVDVWLLGHIHRPAILAQGPPLILYPGSPQGLDPGEPGPHGAWLVTLDPGQPPRADLLPLAALRYEGVDVPLDAVADEAGLDAAVVAAMREAHRRTRETLGPARAVACRLRLVGRTGIHRKIAALREQVRELRPAFDGVEYFVEKIEDASRPAIPLAEMARSNDPAGLLARRLVLLDEGAPEGEYRQLIRDGREAIERGRAGPAFVGMDARGGELTDEGVRALLTRAALTMLEELLAQKEGAA